MLIAPNQTLLLLLWWNNRTGGAHLAKIERRSAQLRLQDVAHTSAPVSSPFAAAPVCCKKEQSLRMNDKVSFTTMSSCTITRSTAVEGEICPGNNAMRLIDHCTIGSGAGLNIVALCCIQGVLKCGHSDLRDTSNPTPRASWEHTACRSPPGRDNR